MSNFFSNFFSSFSLNNSSLSIKERDRFLPILNLNVRYPANINNIPTNNGLASSRIPVLGIGVQPFVQVLGVHPFNIHVPDWQVWLVGQSAEVVQGPPHNGVQPPVQVPEVQPFSIQVPLTHE